MGREVRRVRADWKHPRDERGHYVPLYGETHLQAWTAWEIGRRNWERGRRSGFSEPSWVALSLGDGDWSEWHGPEPEPADYMPPEAFGKRFMMYEDTTEGTPVNDRVALSAGTLAGLLSADGSLRWGDNKASADHWLDIIEGRSFGGLVMYWPDRTEECRP